MNLPIETSHFSLNIKVQDKVSTRLGSFQGFVNVQSRHVEVVFLIFVVKGVP